MTSEWILNHRDLKTFHCGMSVFLFVCSCFFWCPVAIDAGMISSRDSAPAVRDLLIPSNHQLMVEAWIPKFELNDLCRMESDGSDWNLLSTSAAPAKIEAQPFKTNSAERLVPISAELWR